MKIGYARVSTDQQNLGLQLSALQRYGCENVFTDQGISGVCFSRDGLKNALDSLKAGDTFVVWRLDRLGRSLINLVQLIESLGHRQIEFVSLTESINTTSPGGTLMFHMMAALAQFERALIRERTLAGIAEARTKGRRLGRPSSLTDAQLDEARAMAETQSLITVAQIYGIHPRTLARLLKECREPKTVHT